MQADEFRDINYQVDAAGVAKLVLNTPKRKNALSIYTFYEISQALELFQSDDTAHVLILTGAPDPENPDPAKHAFSSGGYFSPDATAGLSEEVLSQLDFNDAAQKKVTLQLFQLYKPVIAAINGLGIGAGFTLPYSGADLIYMADSAWFRLPFAKLGIAPELGSSHFLPRLLGNQKAKEIFFNGDTITAQQAIDLGIANAVVPHNELMETVYEKALELIPPRGAALAVRDIKRLVNEPQVAALSEALDRENNVLRKLFASSDFQEAIMARMERREPVFTALPAAEEA